MNPITVELTFKTPFGVETIKRFDLDCTDHILELADELEILDAGQYAIKCLWASRSVSVSRYGSRTYETRSFWADDADEIQEMASYIGYLDSRDVEFEVCTLENNKEVAA